MASPQSPPSRSCSPPSAPTLSGVSEQWPPQGKIDAGAVAEAIAKTEPDGIFNVTFGADLVKLVREGETRGLFKDRAVVSVLAGEPEYLDPLKDETPDGWIVTGYPWSAVSIPDHAAILKAYQAKYNDYPRLGSVVGYAMLKSAAAILAKANSIDSEKLADAAEASTSTRRSVRSLSAPSTINRRLALSSARPRSRTARA
jgi:branched-chain amino acid transport system substrate-binding protein